jgi:hypothetical protein
MLIATMGTRATTLTRKDRPPTLRTREMRAPDRSQVYSSILDAGTASPMDDDVMIVDAGDAGRHRIVDRLTRELCPLKCPSSSAPDEIKLRGRSILPAR